MGSTRQPTRDDVAPRSAQRRIGRRWRSAAVSEPAASPSPSAAMSITSRLPSAPRHRRATASPTSSSTPSLPPTRIRGASRGRGHERGVERDLHVAGAAQRGGEGVVGSARVALSVVAGARTDRGAERGRHHVQFVVEQPAHRVDGVRSPRVHEAAAPRHVEQPAVTPQRHARRARPVRPRHAFDATDRAPRAQVHAAAPGRGRNGTRSS